MDNVGWNQTGGAKPDSADIRPLTRPTEYPNAFRDVLDKTDEEIAEKIEDSFNQLFYGDPWTESIYRLLGADQAYIEDVLHGQVRTEGIGLGMMITVELNKRHEFDRLWRYARSALQHKSGPRRGYFQSWCDVPTGPAPCLDPFGQQQLAMALLFAHGRWGSDSGTIDYGADALALLDVMQNKEEENGGVIDGVRNTFDPDAQLPFDFPHVAAGDVTRPSILMPAYYDLWSEATENPFWSEVADKAREHLRQVAHPDTGLFPMRATFDGTLVPNWDYFGSESYRTLLNMALDYVWLEADPWQVEEANRLLSFFSSKGIDTYVGEYSLDGVAAPAATRQPALIMMNGAIGQIASTEDRAEYIEAVWTMKPAVGEPRYYPGLLHLSALLVLSGQFRVY